MALGALALLGSGGIQEALAEKGLFSTALSTCMEKSQFTADHFRFSLTPNNGSVMIEFGGLTTIEGYVDVDVNIFAYGYKATTQKLDPCKQDWTQLCPMRAGKFPLQKFKIPLDNKTLKIIPGKWSQGL